MGGSVSGTSLNKAAGARTRLSLLIAGAVMAVILVAFGDAVGEVAMPALGGLLVLIGVRTIRPHDLASVWKTGAAPRTVLAATFMLTLLVPLQYAVVAGVALSAVLYVVGQSNKVTVKRRVFDESGRTVETDPPAILPGNEVVILQPYGSLFFAAAPTFEAALPAVTAQSRNAVVILRLRERATSGRRSSTSCSVTRPGCPRPVRSSSSYR